jgi:23S rRNA (guanosine2251-2'-O)-methyltransferase
MDIVEESQLLGEVDLDRSLAIVVGHEGEGLRRLVRESCDFLIKLPMRGHVESLNAAVAGSVLLYAAWQARGF